MGTHHFQPLSHLNHLNPKHLHAVTRVIFLKYIWIHHSSAQNPSKILILYRIKPVLLCKVWRSLMVWCECLPVLSQPFLATHINPYASLILKMLWFPMLRMSFFPFPIGQDIINWMPQFTFIFPVNPSLTSPRQHRFVGLFIKLYPSLTQWRIWNHVKQIHLVTGYNKWVTS